MAALGGGAEGRPALIVMSPMPLTLAVVLHLIIAGSEHWPEDTKPKDPASVADICEAPGRYADRLVKLKGVFQGYRVADCRFPSAATPEGLTRSDWLFRTGDDCLYVTGGLPSGIDRIDPASLGRRLELTARVARNEAGGVYLRFVEASVLDE